MIEICCSLQKKDEKRMHEQGASSAGRVRRTAENRFGRGFRTAGRELPDAAGRCYDIPVG